MTGTRGTFDPLREVLDAPVSRRGLFKLAAASGIAVPALAGIVTVAGAKQGSPGGTATIVVAANPASWDLTKSTWVTWQAVSYMYDRLLTFDAEENLQPGLATAWEISEDGLTYSLTLREGVSFHDGTPFNADAVKFNFQRHLDMPDSAFYAVYEPIASIDVLDETHVNVVLKDVRPGFAYEGLSQWGAMQVSPTAFEELGSDRFGEGPVGTGPFVFSSYEPGSNIKFARNDNYWGGAPLLDGVEVKVIPEPSVQLIELEAKTADVAQVQAKDVETVEGEGLKIEQTISPGAQFISLNVSAAPTNDLAVRKAIARAIDRDAMIEALMFGFAEKSRAGVNSASPFYTEEVPMIEYDPEEAGRILDEAGWVLDGDIRAKDGQPLKVNILSSDFSDWGLFNQAIQEQLKVIGIDSEISSLEWNAYLDQWRENQGGWNVTYHSQGSIQASVSPIQASWNPDSYWSITQIDDATDPDLVAVRDQLQALSDVFETELDPARQKEIAKEAQQIFQDNQLTVWLWHGATIFALQPRLQGYTMSHAGRVIELAKAYVEE